MKESAFVAQEEALRAEMNEFHEENLNNSRKLIQRFFILTLSIDVIQGAVMMTQDEYGKNSFNSTLITPLIGVVLSLLLMLLV